MDQPTQELHLGTLRAPSLALLLDSTTSSSLIKSAEMATEEKSRW
jgi:hypothetical protein